VLQRLASLLRRLQLLALLLVPPPYSLPRLERFCKRRLELDPSDVGFRLFLATLYFEYHKWEEAKEQFTIMLANGYDEPRVRKPLGMACSRLAQYDVATEHLEAAAASLPKDAEVQEFLGHCLLQTKNYGAAITHFLSAAALSRRSVPVYAGVAYCSFLLGNFENALKYYRKAHALSPENTEMRNNIARSHAEIANQMVDQFRLDEAAAELRLALQIEPEKHLSAEILRTLDAIGKYQSGVLSDS
jgi:tetratricopeptide (TPR) repeat protein